jgi:hypothetical protein
MDEKVCFACKLSKPLTEFHNSKGHSQGRVSRCIPCVAIHGAAWYAKNRRRHNEKARENRYRRNFGMTLKDYDNLLVKQNRLCAICGTDRNNQGKRFSVDHNHKTGAVRGLLCDSCNTGIGMFKDSPSIMLRAINYLG